MQPIGALIATYGISRSFLFVWYFLAAMFGATGIFIFYLISRIGVGLNLSGNVSILYATAFGSISIGIVIAIVAWRLAASQPKFYLHEEAIRAVGRHGDRTDFYRDIEDLYTFFFGGIGYRASMQAPWIFLAGRIHRFADLSQRLRALHVEKRGEQLHQELMSGKRVAFRCLPDSVALSKSLFASRNMDHPTFNVELTSSQLKVLDKRIDIQRISDITTNFWVEKSQILDTDGRVFYTMHPTAVMSFDVLCSLIARLQEGLRNPSHGV